MTTQANATVGHDVVWQAEVQGREKDMELLRSLLTMPAARLHRDGQRYWLESTRFREATDCQEVTVRAQDLLAVLGGITSVLVPGIQSLTLVTCRPAEAAPRRESGARGSIVVSCVCGASWSEAEAAQETAAFLAVAHADPRAANALRAFARADEAGLRDAYQAVIEDIGGEDKLLKKYWVNRRAIQAYAHPQGKPRPLHESQRVIGDLLHEWLRRKA